MRLTNLFARAVAVAALASAALPIVADAADYRWSYGASIPPGYAKYNADTQPWQKLTQAYCNVIQSNRNIYIAAVERVNGGVVQYGTFVNFGSGGWRTYSGTRVLSGSCKNPHTVSINFDAIDRTI